MADDDYTVTLVAGKTPLTFLFDGGPISNPEGAEPVFLALGLAAAAWARLEQHLDAVIIQINKTLHSDERLNLYDPEHPRPFTDKIKLLKRYFKKHPALQKHRKVAHDLLQALPKFALERNSYIHSNMENFDPKTQVVTFRNLHTKKNDAVIIERFTPPLQQIVSFAAAISRANKALRTISTEVFTADAIQQLRTRGPQNPS
jgi:hypothetical protein